MIIQWILMYPRANKRQKLVTSNHQFHPQF